MLWKLIVFVRIVFALGLSAMSVIAVSAGPLAVTAPIAVLPGLRVLRSAATGALLELTTPDYALSPIQSEGRAFESLSVVGLNFTAEAGQPQLPMASALLGVPPEAKVTVRVIAADGQLLPGRHDLIPAASPAPLTDDLQPGQTRRTVDAKAYAATAAYPALAARLADDAWLRDQRLVRIELYPFQYRPRAGQVIWHRTLRVEVTFTRSANQSFKAVNADQSPFDAALRGSLLNYDQARAWRAEPISVARSTLAITPSYKIVVDHDGVYRVTYADLLAAGLDVTNVVPSAFQLTSQQHEVAIEVPGEADGRFDPGDAIVFYGQKLRGDILAARYASESAPWVTFGNGWRPTFNAQMVELYTDDNVYWLTTDGAPGPRMKSSDGTPSGAAPVPEYYTATVHAEKVNYWRTTTFSSVDVFFWDMLAAPVTRSYTTTLSAVATAPVSATVRAEIAPFTANTHRVRLLAGTPLSPLADVSWDGQVRQRIVGQLSLAQLTTGPFTVTLNAMNVDTLFFDWFEVDYARRFEAQANQLAFSADAARGPREYRVSQLLTGTVTVLDITDPLLPRRVLSPAITSSGGWFTATFEVTHTAPVTYFVAGADQIQSPKSISRYAPPDLAGGVGADYVIITHRDFMTAVQPLAADRSAQGLRTRVIDVDDLYNQYNDGIYHPIAIKNFLRDAYANWPKPAPAYVALVGDGHWNFKGYKISGYATPANTPIYLPPNLSWVDPWQGEVDSSSDLAAVSGNDILPDLYIGRILVNSVAELNTVIRKTLNYEQAGILPYQRRVTFVADNIPDDAGDFIASSEAAISYLPAAYAVDRIYENNFNCTSFPCPWVNYALTTTLNLTGALFVNYTGHASVNRWSGESIFVNADVATLTNTGQLPILLSMACLDGYWSHPATGTTSSLIELNVRAANGGAVAAFSPTGLGLTSGHDPLEQGFFTAVFSNGVQRLGPAALAAKLQLFATGRDFDLIHTFTTFGDPALKLPTYALTMTPAADTRVALSGQTVTYTLRVTNSAFMTDVVNFSAAGQTWPLSLPSAQTLSPGASVEAVITVTVPLTVAVGHAEIVTVTAQSKGDATRASAALTTHFYGQALTLSQAQAGDPGQVLTYTLMLSNTGSLTDTLNLATSGQSWPVALSTLSAVLSPATEMTLTAQVTLPFPAWAGQIDRALVSAQSSNSGLISTVSLTSTVNAVYGVTLAPSSVTASGRRGEPITYTLRLTNTGNITTSFQLTSYGPWASTVSPTPLEPLAAFTGQDFNVYVQAPVSAVGSITTVVTAAAQDGSLLLAPIEAATLITTVDPYRIYLPLVRHS